MTSNIKTDANANPATNKAADFQAAVKVVITGATSGIGQQLARDYLKQGAQVYAIGRNRQALDELQQLGAIALEVDLMDREAVIAAIDAIDIINLVICCAGVCEYLDMPDFDSATFMQVMSINMGTLTHTIEAVLPKLIASQGRLVALGSASAYVPFARAEAYGSSKAAIHYLMKTLQISLKPQGVSVTLVVPGFVETPMTSVNDFPMPFVQTPQQASAAIRAGIASGEEIIEFPKKLTVPLKALGALPDGVWQSVSRRLNRDQ